MYKRVGWNARPGESHLDILLRSLVLGRLAWLDDEEAIKEATKRFEDHIGQGPSLPADIRSACYKTVLRAGGKDVYDKMLKLYRSVDLHEEKNRISRAMGATKDSELLQKVLDFSISDEVRSQDTVFVIMSVGMTKKGRELVWKFLKDQWDALNDRYQAGYLLARLVKITENFASTERANEIENFFKEKNTPGTERVVQQSVENIRLNAAWLARDGDSIKNYLKDYR